MVTRRPLFYGFSMLIGVLLFGIAGLSHPILSGDGAAQLSTIAHTVQWHRIHWSLLLGLVFMYVGLIGVSLRHGDTAGSTPARAGALLGAFTFAVWSLNILFMIGAGLQLARAFTEADAGFTATRAVFAYDMLHPMGLAAERLATFMLGVLAYVFGWAIRNGGVWPRWLAWLAWGVAVVNGGVALVFDEFSTNLFFAQGVFVIWLAATAGVMLAERRQP